MTPTSTPPWKIQKSSLPTASAPKLSKSTSLLPDYATKIFATIPPTPFAPLRNSPRGAISNSSIRLRTHHPSPPCSLPKLVLATVIALANPLVLASPPHSDALPGCKIIITTARRSQNEDSCGSLTMTHSSPETFQRKKLWSSISGGSSRLPTNP